MSFLNNILYELEQEGAVTRKHLEKVDFKQYDYQPHEKSEKFGRLAIHVAEIIAWWSNCLTKEELNFLGFEPEEIDNTNDLLSYFDQLLREAKEAIKNASESELDKDWSMKYGDEVLFTLNKKEVLRKFCMNHLIHHRAQLGVYLRLLNIPLPSTYGPSADDEAVTLTGYFRNLK